MYFFYDSLKKMIYAWIMNYTNEMKETVRAAIDKRGWNKAEFMRHAGLRQETARRIYDGISESIDEENVARICKALQLPLDQFWQMSVKELKSEYKLDTIERQVLREASAEYGFSVEVLEVAQRIELLSEDSRAKLMGILDVLEQADESKK